ncbi:23S rRNA (pseudouridine(1915)-N(3))-methyltransferase RlmH [Geomesophilobacter sediminis]|uniref:Ribosomal RNA large subunit methyltransferase H n=1 Tax=Geomesophilobacter sediminis TaxID=2798584 RepID=A0A8J7LYH4_9BACT|nr:23S rRNA (pseudouridine(1915)-N(3))-methyltransferase RlmH [Geomesophilobacter sediminis]MBJ6724807.1 23S rRNA (pseudouridine(1915)-N(3))-methyltransferase RlmH [Geomesophilobacter sediminis]
MKLKVLWVGKTQEPWVRAGIDEYSGRIKRYLPLEIQEAREEKGGVPQVMRERECERLAKILPKGGRLVLLDERGDALTSPEFANFIGKNRDQGTSDLVFAIGGAYGFTDEFRSRAHKTISLSKMTLTHQMVRVFLLEQIYRGFTILNGEPYHHE